MRKDTTMPRQRRAFLLALLPALLPLAVPLLACGLSDTASPVQQGPTATTTPVPRATATPRPPAPMTQVVQSVSFADSKSGGSTAPCANGDPLIDGDCGVSVTATCPSGAVVLSGGFLLDTPLAYVSSSYPSSATAWTVTAHDVRQDSGSHPLAVTAYADCLRASIAAGVNSMIVVPTIPLDGASHEVTFNCLGGVITGGGFRGTLVTQETMPATNGWTVSLGGQPGASVKPSLYLLCATQHLAAAGHPTVTTSAVTGTGAVLSVACPAGTLLVGGGGQTVGYGKLTQVAADDSVTQWGLRVEPPGILLDQPTHYIVVDYAVCVSVS